MEKKTYIALVDDGFILNEETESYFGTKHIKIVNYNENLGTLQLEADYALEKAKLKYVKYLEHDRSFSVE